MKILHLQLELNNSCGITRTVYLLNKNLGDGFVQYVAVLGGDAINKFHDINIHPYLLKYKRYSIFGDIKILLWLIRFCKRNNIDIIHSHHRYFDFLSRVIKYFYPVRTVVSVHSKVAGLKWLSYLSDELIACSGAIRNHLKDNFGIDSGRITVINNFVDTTIFCEGKSKQELRRELKITDDTFIIGFVGRMSIAEKGIDILLNAVRELSFKNKNILLILIGMGEDDNYVKTYITENKLNVMFLGAIQDVRDYYSVFDVAVLPSNVEPFGLIAIEAGIMGCPFIGSRVDGIAELIEDEKDGLLFEKGDTNGLVEKIKSIINDPEYAAKLASNLRNKVAAKYTQDTIIPEYERFYQRVNAG